MNAIKHLTLRERIYEEVVRLIVSGELPSGAPIDERAMITRLDVSRTPFREAIGTLAKEGLVEIKPYRGFFVRSFSQKEISDLYELRKTLECFATQLAVPSLTDQDITEFATLLDDGVNALERGDLKTYAERDREFHGLIAERSNNVALIETLARLDLQIQICRLIANENRGLAERAARERDDILAAFRSRDAQRASELMFAHISDVQSVVIDRFEVETD